MQTRPKPLSIPDRYPFFVVEVPDREPHHMRMPSHLFMARIFGSLEEAADQGSDSFLDPVKLGLMGQVIGAAWSHLEKALDSSGTGTEYGHEVYEELHADGYSFDEILGFYLIVMKAVTDHTTLSTEVAQRAAFFSLRMAPTSLSDSTAASSTSETPGALTSSQGASS